MRPLRLLVLAVLCTGLGLRAEAANGPEDQARTVVHMLDYVGVDYPAFVQGGQVLDTAEYAEQQEFAQQIVALLEALPRSPGDPDLVAHAKHLQVRIAGKADGVDVSALAKALRAEVITTYGIAVAPKGTPDLASANALYVAHCASCHGPSGKGDGPQATGMESAPRDFTDTAAMGVRSIFGLYNTITLGVKGTSMLGFSGLTDAERWALAFHAAGLRTSADEVGQGESLWRDGEGAERFTDLRSVVTATPADARVQGGKDGEAVLAFLTAHPEAVRSAAPDPLSIARDRLDATLDAYRQGDKAGARQLAISAYLEGFELVEAGLDNVDPELRKRTEREMMTLRSVIAADAPVDTVAVRVAAIHALLERADGKLNGNALSATAAFLGSLLILLREGLEALLVLAAIIAFVVRTGRRDALPYIHLGWILAVVLGSATWWAARYVITITGASREMTEGFTALLAVVMLLYVGYWLHNKSNARAWRSFVKGHVTAALGKRTLWAMAGIAFLAVYREFFEVILFYETLMVQAGPDGQRAVLLGIGVGVVLLGLLGLLIMKFSVRLPIGPFFQATAAVLALMAVVFAGNGIAALQEAGFLQATFVKFISVPVLGIHPTAQGLAVQAGVLALVVAGVLVGRFRTRTIAAR